MKTFKQLYEVIKNARSFHLNIAEIYNQLITNTKDNRAKLLLRHMHEHELRMANNLKNYSLINPAKVMQTWIQYTPEESPREVLQGINLTGILDIEEINRLGQQVDQYFLNLYQSIYSSIDVVEVREVFGSLKQIQEKERITLSMASNSLWDM